MTIQINTWSDWIWSTEHKAFYCYLKRPDGNVDFRYHNPPPVRTMNPVELREGTSQVPRAVPAREGIAKVKHNIAARESHAQARPNQQESPTSSGVETFSLDYPEDDEADATWVDESSIDEGQFDIPCMFGTRENGYLKITRSFKSPKPPKPPKT